MAWATGCAGRGVDRRGAAADVGTPSARRRRRARRSTTGRPWVSVPVLSSGDDARRGGPARGAAPPLMRMPRRAAPPSPATTVTGVEITSAHGHASTSSTSARYSQSSKLPAPSSTGTVAVTIGGDEDDRRVDRGEAVDEALGRRPLGLRGLDRAGDAVERAVAARRGDAHVDRAALVDRAAEHRVARLLRDGDALAGDRRLVDARRRRRRRRRRGRRAPPAARRRSRRSATSAAGRSCDAVAGPRTRAVSGARATSERMASRARSRLSASMSSARPNSQMTTAASGHCPMAIGTDHGDGHEQRHRQAPGEQAPGSPCAACRGRRGRSPRRPSARRAATARRGRRSRRPRSRRPGRPAATVVASTRRAGAAPARRAPAWRPPRRASRRPDRRRQRRRVGERVGDRDAPGDEVERQLVDARERLEHVAQLALLGRAVELGDAVRRGDVPAQRQHARPSRRAPSPRSGVIVVAVVVVVACPIHRPLHRIII